MRVILFLFIMLAFVRPAFAVNDPVAYLKFDSDALDYSSSGVHDGTLQNGPVYIPNGGKHGDALRFDGVDDHATIAYSPAVQLPPTGGTIAAWFKMDTISLGQATSWPILWIPQHSNLANQNGVVLEAFQGGPADTPTLNARFNYNNFTSTTALWAGS